MTAVQLAFDLAPQPPAAMAQESASTGAPSAVSQETGAPVASGRPGTGGIYDAPYHTPQHCPLCGGHLVGDTCELCGMEVLL